MVGVNLGSVGMLDRPQQFTSGNPAVAVYSGQYRLISSELQSDM